MPELNNFLTENISDLVGWPEFGAYQPLCPSTMPITFKIAAHDAEVVHISPEGTKAMEPHEIVTQVWRRDGVECQEVLQSSYQPDRSFVPNTNGFINTVIQAYNHHHHLIIRPDDLWIAILPQMNLYINAHAEELRSKFVTHEGRKLLEIITEGTRYSVNYGMLVQVFGNLLQENIADPSLKDWVIPNFSTTTPNDTVACSVMMMSTLKAYFSYKITLRCGIPSVTLLGQKEDYLSILQRIERLPEFGTEPGFFARLLQPIVTEFCKAFDAAESGIGPNKEFWGSMCHYKIGGSGPSFLSGWLGAFGVFDVKGKWQGGSLKDIEKPLVPVLPKRRDPPNPLVFNGLRYPVIDTGDIPDGFAEVDVKLDDNGKLFDCIMVAGHVGYRVSAQGSNRDTLQPSSEWCIFIKQDAKMNA